MHLYSWRTWRLGVLGAIWSTQNCLTIAIRPVYNAQMRVRWAANSLAMILIVIAAYQWLGLESAHPANSPLDRHVDAIELRADSLHDLSAHLSVAWGVPVEVSPEVAETPDYDQTAL